MMYRNQCTPRENLLNRINEVSFAVNDILLYLDTHPKCKEGLAFYQECDIPMGKGRSVQIVYVEL